LNECRERAEIDKNVSGVKKKELYQNVQRDKANKTNSLQNHTLSALCPVIIIIIIIIISLK
jgi:ABC-type polysaccharide transport system permease subunit